MNFWHLLSRILGIPFRWAVARSMKRYHCGEKVERPVWWHPEDRPVPVWYFSHFVDWWPHGIYVGHLAVFDRQWKSHFSAPLLLTNGTLWWNLRHRKPILNEHFATSVNFALEHLATGELPES